MIVAFQLLLALGLVWGYSLPLLPQEFGHQRLEELEEIENELDPKAHIFQDELRIPGEKPTMVGFKIILQYKLL